MKTKKRKNKGNNDFLKNDKLLWEILDILKLCFVEWILGRKKNLLKKMNRSSVWLGRERKEEEKWWA